MQPTNNIFITILFINATSGFAIVTHLDCVVVIKKILRNFHTNFSDKFVSFAIRNSTSQRFRKPFGIHFQIQIQTTTK